MNRPEPSTGVTTQLTSDQRRARARGGQAQALIRLVLGCLLAMLPVTLTTCTLDYTLGQGSNNDADVGVDVEVRLDGGDADADAAPLIPVITVTPTRLDFGAPLLRDEVTLPLVIGNDGNADLQVTAILVEENGALQEVTTDPMGTLTQAIVVAPGATVTVPVTLLPEDAELDEGQIRITSNDPAQPDGVLVPFASVFEGDPALEACVLNDATAFPEPFVDCAVDDEDLTPVIDYGQVQFQEDATRIVVARNLADGNAPLEISAIAVSNVDNGRQYFTVETYFVEAVPGGDPTEVEVPVTLPVSLRAADPAAQVDADVLYIRVIFDGEHDGFLPEESLVIETNDTTGIYSIPIKGVVTGCPTGTWDINLDPEDGCEYACTQSNGGLEKCDGVGGQPGPDNDCDGVKDEENAQGCVRYYRDNDTDTFGQDNDYRCLCSPDSPNKYTATRGGDCDDQDNSVKPGITESCSTSYDDNCNGTNNDVGAIGCSNRFRDQDADGYGVTGDSRCLCQPSGAYSAYTAGDCNDGNYYANPGLEEDCNTPFDDDCDGGTNDENALNCTTYYVDPDNDGYGLVGMYRCFCAPSGNYRATAYGDCNESNPAINPAATEVCDYVDNDCDNQTDEGFNLLIDVNNCGSCGVACLNAHGTTSCVNGTCRPVCSSGWGDCNGDPRDGCETDLSTVTICGACSGDSSCPSGFFCELNTCRAALPLGQPCNRVAQCQSGYCVDGVCCQGSCTGKCRACNLAGSAGTCTSQPAATDPEGECAATAQATCDENGFCDGAGACALWPTGTICTAESCTGNIHTVADTCDGTGLCVDKGTQDCSPYLCDVTTCRTSCTSSSHCISTSYCVGGVCVAKKENGEVCTLHGDCLSGNCVNGICCDTACTGLCRACDLAGFEGTCKDRPAGTDPLGRCPSCYYCDGSGACVPATAGTDIKDNCLATPESGCGTDGACNGSGECRLWPSSTVCVAQTCTGSTKYVTDLCNGSGSCINGGSVDCTPYLCNAAGTDCRTSCTTSTDCVVTSYCDVNVCVGKKGLGQTCTADGDCTSDHCVDGVCCNTTCTGTCQACNLTGTVGTCTLVLANTDPSGECAGLCQSCNGTGACGPTTAGVDNEGECAGSATSTCGLDGQCNGAGACRFWASDTECVPQTCAGYTRQLADICDGLGTCQDRGTANCAPYVCNDAGTDCRGDCSGDIHCTSDAFCLSGYCQFKRPIGQACAGPNQCETNFCVDGYCCVSDCTGTCRSCGLPGAEGVCVDHTMDTDPEMGCGLCRVCDGAGSCTPAATGSDPKSECPQDSQSSCQRDGTCNGTGACRLWASSTVCQTQTCTVSTKYLSDTCNGLGSCLDNGTQDCAPYLCDAGGECRLSCTLDSHCVSGSYCSAGVCFGKKAAGVACGAGNECLSNYCADGVCCNSDCEGTCRACNLAGFVGSCTSHTLGTDPDGECGACRICNGSGACAFAVPGSDPKNDCVADAPSTCDQDGSCDGAGLCRAWASGTVCLASSCTGSTYYPADNCDGAGTCVDSGTVSCVPYTCVGGICGSECTLHTQCATGFYCSSSNTCVAKKALGQTCAIGVECGSSYCADGVCCDGACTSPCRSCNQAGLLGTCSYHGSGTDPEAECGLCKVCDGTGTCTNAAAGTDPKSQCAQELQSSCGLDGQCSGSGTCRFWPSSTVCVAESCVSHVSYAADMCNGSGQCVDSGNLDCSPYECLGSVCRTSCSLDTHCVTGNYCSGGACIPKKLVGLGCSSASECLSDYCTDGVCCNDSCAGYCRACNLAGNVGTCTYYTAGTDPELNCSLCQVCNSAGSCVAATAGTDPKNECAGTIQSTCGLDGQCDGGGACRFWPSVTQCVAASCAGSTFYPVDSCNGTGTCLDSGSQSCAPYKCDATGLACRTSCTLNEHCVTGFYCSTGVCVPVSDPGTPCTLDAQCGTNYCRDGYCCNSDCAEACRACNLTGLQGTCTFYEVTTDPENECGTCQVCNGSGACAAATSGTDPKNQCAAEAQSTCDLTGNCDGAGACALWASGTICLAQSCSVSTLSLADTCDGTGTCTDGGTQSCSPYVCSGSSCATSCTLDSHCVSGYYCSGVACVPKLTNGATCTGSGQCQSDLCVDGVCCNVDCTGTCRACNLSGAVGTCTNIASGTDPAAECGLCQVCSGTGTCTFAANGTDPKSQCAADTQSSCDQNGSCNGAGACALWPSGTVCLAQSCSVSTLYHTDLCDGAGTCVDAGTQSCSPYLCSGSSCGTSCTLDSQCVTGYFCSGGACVPKKALGTFCGAGNECQSGYCVDGVCCFTDCAGPCRACNRSGSEGTCTLYPANTDPEANCGFCQACGVSGTCVPATNGTDPKNQCIQESQASCGLDGQCDGSSTCRYYASGTICVNVTCTNAILSYTDLCNGTGSCVDSGTLSCSPYACNDTGNGCRTSCSLTEHCVTGYTCSGGVCTIGSGKPNGEPCSTDGECANNFCRDGVCCNTTCSSLCQACNQVGYLGTCLPLPPGTDPDGECPPCSTCNGFGGCGYATAGTDPKDDCSQSLPSTCGTDGFCNGTGACRLWASGTVCTSESCTGTTYYQVDTCNGAGSCLDGGTLSCVPYVCGGSSCLTSCATSADCTAGFSCPAGYCVNCGNGVVETGELCDTNNLNGQTCTTQGYDYGTLACSAGCTFDTSGCKTATCTLSEGFEGTLMPPLDWERVQFHPTNTWQFFTFAHSGSKNARVYWAAGQQDEVLITHPIRCTGGTLTFWHAGSEAWMANADVALWVVVGDWDGGTPNDDYLISATLIADGFAAGCSSNPTKFIYCYRTYAIPSQFNGQLIRLAWEYHGADGDSYHLDDVSIY